MLNWVTQIIGFAFRSSGSEASFTESDFKVIVTDLDVSCLSPDGKKQTIQWADLKTVVVRTNDKGTFRTEIFWVLKDKAGHPECIIPLGAKGETELLDRLQSLPEFDDEAFIEAMETNRSKKFTCWRSKPTHA